MHEQNERFNKDIETVKKKKAEILELENAMSEIVNREHQ